MMKGIRARWLLFAAILALSIPIRADMTWREDTHSRLTVNDKAVEKGVEKVRIKLKRGGVRIEDLDEGDTRFCNLTTRSCVAYFSKTNTFDVISNRGLSKASIEENRDYVLSIRRSMTLSADMPEDSRAALQAEYESIEARNLLRAQPVLYEVTDERAEIGGHPCRKYMGGNGDKYYIEVWIAEDIKPEPAFAEYSRFLAAYDPVNYRYYSRVPGFPMKVVLSYGPLTITTEVKSFSEKRVGVSAFLLPEGAKELSSP